VSHYQIPGALHQAAGARAMIQEQLKQVQRAGGGRCRVHSDVGCIIRARIACGVVDFLMLGQRGPVSINFHIAHIAGIVDLDANWMPFG